MRAVSLSDAQVRELLGEKFVCAWVNIAGDPAAGSSHAHPCTDQARDMARGLGEHNTQTLILTPDGRLLSALAGYVGPLDLAEELRFGLALWEAVRQAPADAQAGLLQRAHLGRANDFAERDGRTGSIGAEEQFFGKMWTVGNKRGVADHQFSAAHPLLPADRFTTGLMVGNAQSWFVSETSTSTYPAPPLPPVHVPRLVPPGRR
jgi:hypothetical protein